MMSGCGLCIDALGSGHCICIASVEISRDPLPYSLFGVAAVVFEL